MNEACQGRALFSDDLSRQLRISLNPLEDFLRMAVLRFVVLQSISILRCGHALKDVFPAAIGRAEIKQEMPNLKDCQNISRWVRQCFQLALDLFGIDLGRQESTGGLFLNLFF